MEAVVINATSRRRQQLKLDAIDRAAKLTCPDTQVILTPAFGYDGDHSVLWANQEEVFAVIMKPFKVNELLAQCRKAPSAPSG